MTWLSHPVTFFLLGAVVIRIIQSVCTRLYIRWMRSQPGTQFVSHGWVDALMPTVILYHRIRTERIDDEKDGFAYADLITDVFDHETESWRELKRQRFWLEGEAERAAREIPEAAEGNANG